MRSALHPQENVTCADGITAAFHELDQVHAQFGLDDTGGLSFGQAEHSTFEFFHKLSAAHESEVAAERCRPGIIRMTLGETAKINTGRQGCPGSIASSRVRRCVLISPNFGLMKMCAMSDFFRDTRETVLVGLIELFHLKASDL